MNNVIEYKDIMGLVEYLPSYKLFQVRALGTAESIFAEGENANEIEERFAVAVDEYIEKCTKLKIDPRPKIYGKISDIEIDPKLHERAIVICQLRKIPLDTFIQEALSAYFDQS